MRLTILLIASCFALSCSATTEASARESDSPQHSERAAQLEPVRAAAPWLRKTEHAGVVYFLYTYPARVERYALGSVSWLPPILLTSVPRGFAVSDTGIVVNQATKVSRFNLDGSNESLLPTIWNNADDFAVLSGHYLTSRDEKIQSVRISDATEVSIYESNAVLEPRRLSVSYDASVIYGWQRAGLDIIRIPFNLNGTFGVVSTSPYHGQYAPGTVVYPDRDGATVVDEAGIAFDGGNLFYRSGTGGPINDTVMVGTERFMLRPNSIARLDLNFRETGYLPLPPEAHGVAVFGDRLFLFTGSAVERIPLSRLSEPQSLAAPNPAQPFTADSTDVADDGTLYLFNKLQRVVHRYSLPLRRYLPSVKLPQKPLFASVDRANSRVYVAYEHGRLGVIPRNAQMEQFLAFGPISVRGMGAADEFVITSDPSANARVYNLAGVQTDWGSGTDSGGYSWNRQNRRLYYFPSNGFSLRYLWLSAAGQIHTANVDQSIGSAVPLPIRPSPTGNLVYLGTGKVYDGTSLSLVGALPIPLNDATWLGTALYTTHAATNGRTRIVRWNQNHTISAEAQVSGDPVQLFAVGSEIITAANVRGKTAIQRWPASLSGTNVSVEIASISPPAALGAPVSFTVEVTNHGLQDAGNINVAVALSAPIPQLTWLCDAAQGSAPCGSSAGLQIALPFAVGETFRASAFGFMGPNTVGFQATASGAAGEPDLTDNTVVGQLRLLDTIFAEGFE